MTSRDFAYWLQGFFEVAQPKSISPRGTEMIKNHLALVFKHEIDPSIDKGDPDKMKILDAIHEGKKLPKKNPSPSSSDPIYRC